MRRVPVPLILTLAAALGGLAASCVPVSGPSSSVGDGADGCAVVRVIDGDTVDLTCLGEGSFRARLTGYDTPESYEPRCRAEALAAGAATDRLRALVRQADTVEARLGGFDRYDRRLVTLRLDGRDVGTTLVAEGLAVSYSGGPRSDWCARLT
jgi:endonuclease YncB( thermonuclease family)